MERGIGSSVVLFCGMFLITPVLEALIVKGYRPFAATTSGKCFLIEDCRSPLANPDPAGEKGSRIFVATGDNGFKSIRMSSRRSPPSEYTTSKFFDLLKNSQFNTKKVALQFEASGTVHFFYRTDTPAVRSSTANGAGSQPSKWFLDLTMAFRSSSLKLFSS